jgi:hypothetical protein
MSTYSLKMLCACKARCLLSKVPTQLYSRTPFLAFPRTSYAWSRYPLPRLLISVVGGARNFEHLIETRVIKVCPSPLALCPSPLALCPSPLALCPSPLALCPSPLARKAPLAPTVIKVCPSPLARKAPLAPTVIKVCPSPLARKAPVAPTVICPPAVPRPSITKHTPPLSPPPPPTHTHTHTLPTYWHAQALQKGLSSAARVANAWVLTGGSDVGIMKIVGQAMADVADNVQVVHIKSQLRISTPPSLFPVFPSSAPLFHTPPSFYVSSFPVAFPPLVIAIATITPPPLPPPG